MDASGHVLPFKLGDTVMMRWCNQETEPAWGMITACFGKQVEVTGEPDELWYLCDCSHIEPGTCRPFYVSLNCLLLQTVTYGNDCNIHVMQLFPTPPPTFSRRNFLIFRNFFLDFICNNYFINLK